MPQLSDLIEKKKFVKKSYRPWDLSGEGTIDGKEAVRLDDRKLAVKEKSAEVEVTSFVSPIAAEIQVTASMTEIDNKTGNITGNKEVTKRVTNREQRGNKEVTNREQTGNITGNITGNVTGNITGNNQDTFFLSESIKKLGGIQKSIFFYILNLCTARGVLDTGNLLSSDLANAGSCTIGSAKTSLNRLVEKRLVHRLPGKACRGGHMVLGITKEIQAAAMQAQQALFNPLKREVTGNITGNVTGNITGNSFLYSSSNKNTTTTALPDDWKKIELEPLQHIGFSETQLRQLCESGITTAEIVQDAIHRFAYSLANSDKVKAYADPLNVLMGVLRKGQRWNEPHYVPLKERLLRELLDEKRKQKELRDTMIKELIELEFPEWKRKLSEEQFNGIVPEDIRKNNIAAAIQAVLRTYFTEQVLLPRLENELGV